MTIAFKRGRRADTSFGDRLIYLSRCGGYRLERHDMPHLGTSWYAVALLGGCQHLISRHRTRSAAERACLKHQRKTNR